MALRNGRNALCNFQHILCHHLHVDVKLFIIKAYIAPEMQYGMEVWFPRTLEEKRGEACLNAYWWTPSENRSA
jgi:hypothetical protein